MTEQAFIDADYIPCCIMNTLYVLSGFIFTRSLEVASLSLYRRRGNRGKDRLNAYSELSNWDANILVHFWSLCSSLLWQAAYTKKSNLRKYLTGQEPSIWETAVAWCRIQFLINLKFITFLISTVSGRQNRHGPGLMPLLGFWPVTSSQLFFHWQATAVQMKLGHVSVLCGRFRGGWGTRASSEAKPRVLSQTSDVINLSPQRPHKDPWRGCCPPSSHLYAPLWGKEPVFQCLGERKQLALRGVKHLSHRRLVARCQGPQIHGIF